VTGTFAKVSLATLALGCNRSLLNESSNKPEKNMSDKDLQDELERLRSENAALKSTSSGVRMKVSEKGALSIYGMGRP
jgi:hypothetical protein